MSRQEFFILVQILLSDVLLHSSSSGTLPATGIASHAPPILASFCSPKEVCPTCGPHCCPVPKALGECHSLSNFRITDTKYKFLLSFMMQKNIKKIGKHSVHFQMKLRASLQGKSFVPSPLDMCSLIFS